MDIAEEIANYLTTVDTSLVVGTDIFVGQIPDDKGGIWVQRSAGAMNNYVPIEETVLDIYSKYTNASEGIDKLESLKRAIHRMYSTQTANGYIYSMLVISDVEDVSRDQNGYKIFKFSISLMHRDTKLLS